MDDVFFACTDEELSTHEVQINRKLDVIAQKIARLKEQKQQLLKCKETIQNLLIRRQSDQLQQHDWDKESFDWSGKVRKTLSEVFHLQDFRPQQLRTINALLAGHDVLLLAPTGGGKSLCFQLPALITPGLTVVISPLVSLMEDQVWSLQKLNIAAKLLCSTTERSEANEILRSMANPSQSTVKLLYVTPERMSKSKRFMSALQKCFSNGQLDRFAIDEVHCCSQWGHDFRPDYKYLGVLKELFPKIPVLGVTATATAAVIKDVQKMLRIPNSILFVASFNRPNLYYHVLEKPLSKKDQYEVLESLLEKRFHKQSGIVYTFSIKDAEEISEELRERGLKVAPYHATLPAAERTKIHQLWIANRLQAVIATVAFGMGIDKPDVRFVIHHTLSKSMENFYQETGRAGRDGQPADCILLYHFSDMFRISTMMFSEYTGLQNAYAMVDYCINRSDCRRKLISQHFSEVWGPSDCQAMCDRCVNFEHALLPEMNVLPDLKQLVMILENAEKHKTKMTALRLVDAWFHKGPTKLRLDSPPPIIDRDVGEQIVAFLILKNYLKVDFVYTPHTTLAYIKPSAPPDEEERLLFRAGKLYSLSNRTGDKLPARRTKLSFAELRSSDDDGNDDNDRDDSTAPSKRRKSDAQSPPPAVVNGSNQESNESILIDDADEEDVIMLEQDVIEIDGD
ncbi:ATP-dependent DNA helicase Q1-like [Anopheles darlingi]|uniref:ATP-dependent DNA helicase Q1-like n=1 Tax=Anopheles darlingi TaxID=43151 RepID=UPI0021006157|nr:ATP-dependent DNA helicase Q1-like [Anopheles darlingi]